MILYVVATSSEREKIFDGLTDKTVLTTGIGKINTALRLTEYLCENMRQGKKTQNEKTQNEKTRDEEAQNEKTQNEEAQNEKTRIDEVINIGVCGGSADTKIGEVFSVGTVTEADYDTSLFGGDSDFNRIELGVGRKLATADKIATEQQSGSDLYDMEGFSAAKVCRYFGIPCRLVKSVSDILGQNQADSYSGSGFDAACRALRHWVQTAENGSVENRSVK
jgi:nucleoside phosphorylase